MRDHEGKTPKLVEKACKICFQSGKRTSGPTKTTCYVFDEKLFWFNCDECGTTMVLREDDMKNKIKDLTE